MSTVARSRISRRHDMMADLNTGDDMDKKITRTAGAAAGGAAGLIAAGPAGVALGVAAGVAVGDRLGSSKPREESSADRGKQRDD